MNHPTREIEVYRCWDDRTWDTEFVEIPADTPEENIEAVAASAALEALRHSADLPVVVGVYHIPEISEEE
jgi:hypothetical protein